MIFLFTPIVSYSDLAKVQPGRPTCMIQVLFVAVESASFLVGEAARWCCGMLSATAVTAHGVIHSSGQDSNEILGTCSEIITSTARYIFDVVKSEGPSTRSESRMSKSRVVQARLLRQFRAKQWCWIMANFAQTELCGHTGCC